MKKSEYKAETFASVCPYASLKLLINSSRRHNVFGCFHHFSCYWQIVNRVLGGISIGEVESLYLGLHCTRNMCIIHQTPTMWEAHMAWGSSRCVSLFLQNHPSSCRAHVVECKWGDCAQVMTALTQRRVASENEGSVWALLSCALWCFTRSLDVGSLQ